MVILEISSYAKPTENNAFQYDWNNILKIKYPRNDPIIKSPINTIYIKPNIESIPLLRKDDPFCVQKVEISPNGKLIASGGTDGIVKLWKYDFINPNNTLSLIKQINITRQHFAILKRERDKRRIYANISIEYGWIYLFDFFIMYILSLSVPIFVSGICVGFVVIYFMFSFNLF